MTVHARAMCTLCRSPSPEDFGALKARPTSAGGRPYRQHPQLSLCSSASTCHCIGAGFIASVTASPQSSSTRTGMEGGRRSPAVREQRTQTERFGQHSRRVARFSNARLGLAKHDVPTAPPRMLHTGEDNTWRHRAKKNRYRIEIILNQLLISN